MPAAPGRDLTIETYVPYLVNRAATAMINFSAAEFGRHGLTVPKWRILFALWNHKACPFGELALLTSIEPPTLSRLLNGMVTGRLVRRVRHATDRRSSIVELTAAGRAAFARTIAFAEESQRSYTRGLSRAQLTLLRSALSTIYDNVARLAEERGT